jgi:hypothetical protein
MPSPGLTAYDRAPLRTRQKVKCGIWKVDTKVRQLALDIACDEAR